MAEMKPLSVGIVEDSRHGPSTIVMRSQKLQGGEIINLSDPTENACWTDDSNLLVRLLPRGESITIKLFNH